MMHNNYETMVIGVSAGGLAALTELLPGLSPVLPPLAVVIVQHLHPTSKRHHVEHLQRLCPFPIKEAEEKETICPGTVYFAPPEYHLLIERDRTFSFSLEEKVSFSRPSIDVLFESAAVTYNKNLIGIILTGANADGAAGLAMIKQYGGLTIVQSPQTSEVSFMPEAAIAASEVDHICDLKDIITLLTTQLSK